jgi:hypothetical protein
MATIESPTFDARDLLGSLKAEAEPAEPVAPVAAAVTAPAAASDVVAYLRATPAPAVGTLAYATPDELATALQEYGGTGVYDRALGRSEARATVVHVDRETIGRYVLTVEGIARNPRPDVYVPGAGETTTELLRWLTNAVVELARAHDDAPLLVVCSDLVGLDPDALAPLAVEAGCVVAVAEHHPKQVAVPQWEPRLLTAKPTPAPVVEPERKPSAAQRMRASKPGAAGWLARVTELVKGYPEVIPGPGGEAVAVAYGRRDMYGREHVALRATQERPDGRVVPMELELAPGVLVALEDCRIYV